MGKRDRGNDCYRAHCKAALEVRLPTLRQEQVVRSYSLANEKERP